MSFWTCGPFKKAHDDLNSFVYNAERIRVWTETLEEALQVDEIIENGTPDEKLLASMMKLDIDRRLEVLIGVGDGHEETDDEIPRETILESIKRISKE